MLDHIVNDWRDVIPRITIPTLIIGGARSHTPAGVTVWAPTRSRPLSWPG